MDTYYNPDQAAPLVGASASTIRNWCKTYASQLSAGANPPTGTERRLTQQDVAKLQQIKVWRDARTPAQEIIRLLQAAAESSEPTALTIDVPAQPTEPKPQAPDAPALLTVALHSMEKRQDATDKRIDQLQQTIAMLEQRQAARINALITGIVIGGTAVLIIVGLVLAMGR